MLKKEILYPLHELKIQFPSQAKLPRDKQPKCVIKITAGGKFYIGRSLNFDFIETEIREIIKRYKYKKGIYETHLYYQLAKYIVDKDLKHVTVEIIFEPESGYAVLKEELRQLEAHFGKRNCPNQNKIPYVPKFKTPSSPNKWLTHNEFLNFKKLLAKYEY